MSRSILKININNELDVVLAYKRAMQLSERLGIALANQTKFATAVSEICRNVVEYVGNGSIQFNLADQNGENYLEALISDKGRGIGNLDAILAKSDFTSAGRGTGILNSKKLADNFHIESEFEKGTRVRLWKRIPPMAPSVSKALLDNWAKEFDQDADISPYAEIKKQNMQLLELLEQLRIRNIEAEQQLQEIRRLNARLQQSNLEINTLLEDRDRKNSLLQDVNNSLDAFAHTVSHDLRAPLQNIYGIANALEVCLEANQIGEARQVFPLLRQQTQKMDRLITGILAYSVAGHRNIQKNAVSISALLNQVVSSLNIPTSFSIHIPPALPMLYTQEIYLYQAFSNIIGNSIKHHDQPDKAVVEITCEADQEYIFFTVRDNGPGIPRERQQQLMSQQYIGGTEASSLTSGLGLSIVKRIVQEKGGKLWVESEGRGSTFRFTWPASEIITEHEA